MKAASGIFSSARRLGYKASLATIACYIGVYYMKNMARKTPKVNVVDTFENLREAVDPDAPNEKIRQTIDGPLVDTGEKPFLAWHPDKDEFGREMWYAIGFTGKRYEIRDNSTPPPPKQGKLTIS